MSEKEINWVIGGMDLDNSLQLKMADNYIQMSGKRPLHDQKICLVVISSLVAKPSNCRLFHCWATSCLINIK